MSERYDVLNRRKYGRAWTVEELMLGFVGDVGDLAKLVLAVEGVRTIENDRAALEHELADCLWSTLVLAHRYEVDLNAALSAMMEHVESSIARQLHVLVAQTAEAQS